MRPFPQLIGTLGLTLLIAGPWGWPMASGAGPALTEGSRKSAGSGRLYGDPP